jgi:hypothetical protein
MERTPYQARAAYGLWKEPKKEEKHLLSEEEVLEKKKLRAEYNAKPENKKKRKQHQATPAYKAWQHDYDVKPATKETKRAKYAKDKGKRDATNCDTYSAAFLPHLLS